jgi:hypothetical protein
MGGSIIEMAIVLAAAALLTIQGIQEDVAHRRAQLLAIEGQNEAIINEALSHWVTDNYAAVLAQFTASGSATLTPPTIDQLFTNGNLKQPHRNGPFWGGTYTITMTMVPPTCSATAGNCHVAYLMYPSQPLLRRGQYLVWIFELSERCDGIGAQRGMAYAEPAPRQSAGGDRGDQRARF